MPFASVAMTCMKNFWPGCSTAIICCSTSSGVLPERVMIVGLVVTPEMVRLSLSFATVSASAVSRISSILLMTFLMLLREI